MQKERGLYKSEFWVGALGIATIVLLVLDGVSSSDGPGLSGIALIVSTYIGGRYLIKAARPGAPA
jgi:hypothetical protein